MNGPGRKDLIFVLVHSTGSIVLLFHTFLLLKRPSQIDNLAHLVVVLPVVKCNLWKAYFLRRLNRVISSFGKCGHGSPPFVGPEIALVIIDAKVRLHASDLTSRSVIRV